MNGNILLATDIVILLVVLVMSFNDEDELNRHLTSRRREKRDDIAVAGIVDAPLLTFEDEDEEGPEGEL